MKTVVLAPDSFKGTLSAREVCQWMERGLARGAPGCRTVWLPVADGGEGTVEALLLSCGGQRRTAAVHGPSSGELPAFGEMASTTELRAIGNFAKKTCVASDFIEGMCIGSPTLYEGGQDAVVPFCGGRAHKANVVGLHTV